MPRHDYGLGDFPWQILAPRFCARHAAASGRSTGHGARMPSLQDLEKRSPEDSQLQLRILLHRDPGCSGLRLEAHPAADREWGGFSKTPRHRTSEFFITAAAAASHIRQHRAGGHGRLTVTLPSAVQEPAIHLPPWQSTTLTCDSSAVLVLCKDHISHSVLISSTIDVLSAQVTLCVLVRPGIDSRYPQCRVALNPALTVDCPTPTTS